VIKTEPCSRGVRQIDCLSPLLFCQAEEALGRNITKLAQEGKVLRITGSKSNFWYTCSI